ncbi:MAG: helix-turn-helix domain-containing protein [Rhizobiaceae bacterium]
MAEDNVSIMEIPGSGARFAVMPEADFLIIENTLKHLGIALRSKDAAGDVRDIIEASLVRGRIERGEEESYPAALVSAMIAGENPIRAFRNWRGLSAGDLASQAGISAPYLSGIENGNKVGSLVVLKRIAAVLSVDLDDIISE